MGWAWGVGEGAREGSGVEARRGRRLSCERCVSKMEVPTSGEAKGRGGARKRNRQVCSSFLVCRRFANIRMGWRAYLGVSSRFRLLTKSPFF